MFDNGVFASSVSGAYGRDWLHDDSSAGGLNLLLGDTSNRRAFASLAVVEATVVRLNTKNQIRRCNGRGSGRRTEELDMLVKS